MLLWCSLGILIAGSWAVRGQANDPDSLSGGDTTTDSLQTLAPPSGSKIEGPVKYQADRIEFSIPTQTTRMFGDVRIQYENMTLTAGKVSIDWQRNNMVAEAISDTSDSSGAVTTRGLPVLTEKGSQPIEGVRLEYDFKNRRGRVLAGKTNMSPGYYRGEDIRKVGNETLLIREGYFTTCELDTPHFCFRSQKMRIRVGDRAIAKPVILYIADVPVLAAPFAAFSLKRGRRSGIILPTFGENSTGGRYLEEFGYYWAPSDYFDVTLLSSFYEKTGLLYTGNFNYKKRYAYDGNVSGSYSPRNVVTGARVERWRLDFRHNQKIGQTLNINAKGSFLSDNSFYRDYSSDFNQRTNQTLSTDLSIKKTFPGSRVLSVDARRVENLQTERIDYTLPAISFSQPARSLFAKKSSESHWYHNIKYRYSTDVRSKGFREAILDDTTGNRIGFNRERTSGWQHNITPSFSTKVMKYFNLSPSMNFQELWSGEYLDYTFVDSLNATVADTVKEFRARHLVQGIGLNLSTTLYGLWDIPFSPLKVIRHKIDPSIGFSYLPDYSDEQYGYYQTFTDTLGNTLKRDRFARNAFGSPTPQGERRNMNIRVSNLFQGKLIGADEEKKIDLFRVDFSTSHNFALDSLNWSDLRTSFQAKPHQSLNISMNASHSFYKLAANGSDRRNEFVWADGFALPELLDWEMAMRFNTSIRPPQKKKDDTAADSLGGVDAEGDRRLVDGDGYILNRDRDFDVFEGFNMPWSLDMNFTFSYSDRSGRITRRLDANFTGRIQLTKNWNVYYSSQLDLIKKDIVNQRFTINRDLHCWQMNINWTPGPTYSAFRFEIRVKESLFKDLKLTKTSNSRPF